jgi:hypothetical protein
MLNTFKADLYIQNIINSSDDELDKDTLGFLRSEYLNDTHRDRAGYKIAKMLIRK